MNKLLQYLTNKPDVNHRALPGLEKFMRGGQPCYECGGSVNKYAVGGLYDCPDQEKDPETGKCKAEVVRGREAAAANKAANADMNAWAKQVAAMDKEVAKQNAAQAAGQLSFDYDWMQSPVDKADKKAAMAQYKQFFQQNPNVFVPDDTSGYSPEQKYIIASKLKQRLSTPMGAQLAQKKLGVDPRYYDLQRMQSELAPKMGGWEGMRNFLFNVHKQNGGPIVDPMGQWAHPGQVTRIPGSDITMQGVPYPVYGVGSNGQEQMMYPGQEYDFGSASYVDEYPMMQFGGGTLLGPMVPMMSKMAPKIASMFSGNPLKKFINWANEPTQETQSNNKPAPTLVEAPVRTYGYSDTYSEYRDRANDVYSQLKNNDRKEYNSPKQITLSSGRFTGAKVDPEMINDIVKAAKDNNIDPWVMLSLVGRESTFGSGTTQNTLRSGSKQNLVSGWDVAEEYMPYSFDRFLADRQVPGVKVVKDNHGWNYVVKDKNAVNEYLKKNPNLIDTYYDKLESTPELGKLDSFALAAQRIKKKGIQNYNPGDPKYPSMVNADMNLLKQDAELKAYMKSKGYKQGGELASGLLSKSVSCSNCGWSWKAVEGGINPLTCHKCGGMVKMQKGGTTLPEITVYGHKNPGTKSFFDNLRKNAESEEDRDINNPIAKYRALEQMYSRHGAPKINMIDSKTTTPNYNLFTDSINIGDGNTDDFLHELSHKVQANEKGRFKFAKEFVSKDLFNTLKNVIKGQDPYSAYLKNYDIDGTIENEAHNVIYPKLKDEFSILADKEYLRYNSERKRKEQDAESKAAAEAIRLFKIKNGYQNGGQHGGLDRWFAEKWVDVKTGKTCGRQEGENRAYPACRPSKRVSSETPKTSSEMSPAEKAKFKASKTSSQRINYNHKRNK